MVMTLRILPNSRSERESSGFVCLITAHPPPTSNGFFKALLHTFCCPLQASYHSKQSLKLIIVVVVICEYSRAGLVRFLHGKSDTFIDLHAYIKHGREEHILMAVLKTSPVKLPLPSSPLPVSISAYQFYTPMLLFCCTK